MPKRFTLRARLRSFGYAAAGLRAMLALQHNARIHAVATLAVLALSAALGLSGSEWRWIIAAIAAVWSTEALNTALESLADAVAPDPHPLVGRAKDAAAGAVLVAAIGAALIGLLVLGPHLLALLTLGSLR
jgi:diacylglycerol kinase (ATP)